MTVVYINEHPDYNYASAVLGGYCDLREYVKAREYLSWVPRNGKSGCIQIMISEKDKHPEYLENFISHVKEMGCEVKRRDNRGDEWETV